MDGKQPTIIYMFSTSDYDIQVYIVYW